MNRRADGKGRQKAERRVASSRKWKEGELSKPLAYGPVPALTPELSRASGKDRRPLNRRHVNAHEAVGETKESGKNLERRVEEHRRTGHCRKKAKWRVQSAETPDLDENRRDYKGSVCHGAREQRPVQSGRHGARAAHVKRHQPMPDALPRGPRSRCRADLKGLEEGHDAQCGQCGPRKWQWRRKPGEYCRGQDQEPRGASPPGPGAGRKGCRDEEAALRGKPEE